MSELSGVDIEILNLLNKYPEGMSLKDVALKLNKKSPNLDGRIKSLRYYGFIENGRSSLSFIKLIRKDWKDKIMILTCPFCKTEHIVSEEVFKINCSNKECKKQIYALHKWCSHFSLKGRKEEIFK